MTRIAIQKLNTIWKNKESIINFLILSIMILIGFYAYFLHGAITNVVEKEKIISGNRTLSTVIIELEAKYFSTKNSIDMDLAYKNGYKDSQISLFISKIPVTALLSSNELQ